MWADNVSIAFFAGHGNAQGPIFGRRIDSGQATPGEVRLGDIELEWIAFHVVAEVSTISPDHLIDILRRDETFAQLRPGESSVHFHDCRIGFYALPPREVQRILVPMFALSGTASTPAVPRYDFMRYVPVVALPLKNGAAPATLRAMASL